MVDQGFNKISIYKELNSGNGPFVVTRFYFNSFRHRHIFQWSKYNNAQHIAGQLYIKNANDYSW